MIGPFILRYYYTSPLLIFISDMESCKIPNSKITNATLQVKSANMDSDAMRLK